MDMRKISVSFRSCHEDIYNYLKEQNNISAYICKLVQNDMSVSGPPQSWEEKVLNLITKTLEKDNMQLGRSSPPNLSAPTEEETSIINNLF